MVFSISGAQSLSTVILEPCNSRFDQCLSGLLVLVLCIKPSLIHKYKQKLLVHLIGHKFKCIFCFQCFIFLDDPQGVADILEKLIKDNEASRVRFCLIKVRFLLFVVIFPSFNKIREDVWKKS